jgi:hypothetical protein
MELKWASFPEQVRDIATKIYGQACEPATLKRVELDGLIELGPDYFVAILCANDVMRKELQNAIRIMTNFRKQMIQSGIYVKAFVVSKSPFPVDLSADSDKEGVTTATVSSFASLLIEYEKYRSARLQYPFGSSVDPKTGAIDRIAYVPVRYKSVASDRSYGPKDIAALLLEGRKIVLLGEFGSGKSRCIAEIYSAISNEWGASFQFPFAINLRECWGMRTADELVRRHISTVNLPDLESASVKVLKRQAGIYLLDGFDELGSQAWSSDESKLRALRAQALSGVRDLVEKSDTGVLVAGREHYFSSFDEMIQTLGLANRNPLVLRVSEEFTIDEMEEYFDAANIQISLPSWLPRRPLICQTISQLSDDDIGRMFSEERREAEFWEHFIDIVCTRDARISEAFDADKIFAVYVELARISRHKPMNVGPFSLREMQAAFEQAIGQAPTEDASVMLQRLPSLGRVGAESVDRQFVDTYILDGLRAKDVARIPDLSIDTQKLVLDEQWSNPLNVLGQRVLARSINKRGGNYLALLQRCVDGKNGVLTADFVSSFTHTESVSIDFKGLTVAGATFANLNFGVLPVSNLRIEDSILEELVLPATAPVNVQIVKCSAGTVAGASTATGLPSWVGLDSVDEYDSVQNVSRIRNTGLSASQEIFLAIVKKTFFQRGAGRKEDALLRGFGNGAPSKVAGKVLNLLVRYDVLSTFRGKEGLVYTPVREKAGRMDAIRRELVSSTDEIWLDVSKINSGE